MWQDMTRYTVREEKGDIEPRTWAYVAGCPWFIVTRKDNAPNTWFLTCATLDIKHRDLDTNDLALAKTRATNEVRKELIRCAELLPKDKDEAHGE